MSRRLRLLSAWLRLTEKRRLSREADPARLRRGFERQSRLFLPAPRGATRRMLPLGDREALAVRGAGGPDRQDAPILHFHGGAYVMGSPRTHWKMLARLSALTGRPAFLPAYRLAPEHPCPAAIEDALAVWRAICTRYDPARIVLGGDSAGGGLALGLLGEILRLGLPAPGALYAMSPFTDMTFSGASIRENAERDALLPVSRLADLRKMVMAGGDPEDPRISPLQARFAGAGPVWLCCSEAEILRDDTLRMAARLRDDGVAVTLVREQTPPHVWPIFAGLIPEADVTLDALARWIEETVPDARFSCP